MKNIKLQIKTSILLLSLVFFSTSACDKENQNNIPNVYVSININPTSALYSHLSVIGGWEYLTGGYRGILVYHSSLDEFVAFDRACTYDYKKENARIEVEANGLTMIDSCCGSRFLILDGSPVNGPANVSLKQYRTSYDGYNLSIYN